MATPRDFRLHLLGGVTIAEAEAVQAMHEHTWTHCKRFDCGEVAEAVVLLRPVGGGPGSVDGCPDQAQELLLVDRAQQTGGREVHRETRTRPDR